jgi:hypothetical protein
MSRTCRLGRVLIKPDWRCARWRPPCGSLSGRVCLLDARRFKAHAASGATSSAIKASMRARASALTIPATSTAGHHQHRRHILATRLVVSAIHRNDVERFNRAPAFACQNAKHDRLRFSSVSLVATHLPLYLFRLTAVHAVSGCSLLTRSVRGLPKTS